MSDGPGRRHDEPMRPDAVPGPLHATVWPGPGDGRATPAVLVHGWMSSSATWCRLLPGLAATRPVVAVDLRGHGGSTAPDGSRFTPEELSGDLAEVVAALGRPVVLVGHSFGASLAVLVAARSPELVRALVAIDPDYAGDPCAAPRLRLLVDRLAGADADRAAVEAVSMMEGPGTPEELRRRHRAEALATPPAVRARVLDGIVRDTAQVRFRPGCVRLLERRRVPVLAFHRTPDRAHADRLCQRSPDSRVLRVTGTGHWIHQERPADVTRETLRWLAGTTS